MVENLEYNSLRPKLIILEYGRHVQKLINHCVLIEDKEERNKMSRAIVALMGSLQPHLRDVNDFKHKLWDQLFIMSDFKIDVDSPYERPKRETFLEKPEKLSYPQKNHKYRFYGNKIQLIINAALTWEASERKTETFLLAANHMKNSYINFNRADVKDAVIFEHLFEISNGKVDLRNSGIILAYFKEVVKKKKPLPTSKRTKKKSSFQQNTYKNNREKYQVQKK